MSEFVEQVQLPIQCELRHRSQWFPSDPPPCHSVADVTVVVLDTDHGRQNLVLYPVGWQPVPNEGFEGGEAVLGALCPEHAVPTVGRSNT